jgi:SHS2 domain-containing protein
MREFKFIEHTADIAVDVRGDSLEELFTASAEAFSNSIADPFQAIDPKTHKLTLTSDSTEELLVDFLNELNYLTEVKKLIYFEAVRVAISAKDNIFELSVDIKLNRIESDTELKNEIKAITYHQMKIEFKDNWYTTRIVFDI